MQPSVVMNRPPSMRLLLAGNYWAGKEDIFSKFVTIDHVILRWEINDGLESFASLVRDADVLVVSADVALDGTALPLLKEGRRLKLIHLPFAGYDWLPSSMVPEGCQVCNVHEHSSAIAEYVLAGMLEMAIGLNAIDRSFRDGSWEYGGGIAMGKRHGELRGKRLGIFGYGHIGREVALRAKAFGMSCCAVSSMPRPELPSTLDWQGGPESFPRLLAESDYLLVAAPLNDKTRGKFDANAFASMKEGSVIINVGRGPIIDPAALFNALKNGHPRGAVLDVWYKYPDAENGHPQPADQPFETLSNVIMTPHCASWTIGQDERRILSIAQNLAHLQRGEKLINAIIFNN